MEMTGKKFNFKKLLSVLVLIALLAVTPAFADDAPVKYYSDANGSYYFMGREMDVILIKHIPSNSMKRWMIRRDPKFTNLSYIVYALGYNVYKNTVYPTMISEYDYDKNGVELEYGMLGFRKGTTIEQAGKFLAKAVYIDLQRLRNK